MDEPKSPEQLSAYERWELPVVEGQIVNASVFSPLAPEAVEQLTAEQVEDIRRAAYKEGHAAGKTQGFKKGHEDGMAAAAEEMAAETARINQVLRALLQPIHEQDESLQKTMLGLCCDIAKTVVRRELFIDRESLHEVLGQALRMIRSGAERVRIHLHPEDAVRIESRLREQGVWNDDWRIVPHQTLTPGGCVVETDQTIVDATIERRIQDLVEQIYEQDASRLKGAENDKNDPLGQLLSSSGDSVDASEHRGSERDGFAGDQFIGEECETVDAVSPSDKSDDEGDVEGSS